jgi:hypothetical protein
MVNDAQYIETYYGLFVNTEYIKKLVFHCKDNNIIDFKDEYDDTAKRICELCYNLNYFFEENKINLKLHADSDQKSMEYNILFGMSLDKKKYYDYPSSVFIDYGSLEDEQINNENEYKKSIALFEKVIGFDFPKEKHKLISMLHFT